MEGPFICKINTPKSAWTLWLEYIKMIVNKCHTLVTGAINEAVAVALGYLPEREVKPLLLKAPHTLDTVHKEMEMVLFWRPQGLG